MSGPRSSWAGPITFGGFPFGVKAYPLLASASKDRVKTLCSCHNTAINAPKVCSVTRKELTADQQIKGVEKSKDAYAVVDSAALDAASGPKSPAIVPQRVVHLTTVPFHLTVTAWRLVPEPGQEAAVAGLQAILQKSGKALEMPGFVPRNGSPDTVVIVYGRDDELLASTIADTTKINPAPAVATPITGLPDAQLAIFTQVLDTLYPQGDFDVTAFTSQHATRRAAAINAALAGTAVATPTTAAPAAPAVPDLMAALEASLKAAQNKEPIAA
jgi:non-homologous end joining protein Ku